MNRFIAYDVSARTKCTVRQKGRVVSLKHSTWRVVNFRLSKKKKKKMKCQHESVAKKKNDEMKLRYEPVKLFMDVEITPA